MTFCASLRVRVPSALGITHTEQIRLWEWKRAALSSAISARESSYKKHLLRLVLSMMLWKIHSGIVLFALSWAWVSECVCLKVRNLEKIRPDTAGDSSVNTHNAISRPVSPAPFSMNQCSLPGSCIGNRYGAELVPILSCSLNVLTVVLAKQ